MQLPWRTMPTCVMTDDNASLYGKVMVVGSTMKSCSCELQKLCIAKLIRKNVFVKGMILREKSRSPHLRLVRCEDKAGYSHK